MDTHLSIVTVGLIGFGSPQHFNIWNNLSLDTLAGDLSGHFGDRVRVSLFEANVAADLDDVLAKLSLSKHSFDIIGLSIQPGSLELATSFLKNLSTTGVRKSNTLMVFGNQIPTYCPEAILAICPEGIIVRGEGECSLRGLVHYILGETILENIPNLVCFDQINDKRVNTRIETPDLSSVIHPPTTGTWSRILHRGGNVQIQASRGCPWGYCSYCTRTSFRRGGLVAQRGLASSWSGFPVDRILKTLEIAMSQGVSEVEFTDDEFFGGRSDEMIMRVDRIADGIERISRRYKLDFTFRIFTRANIIYSEKDADKKNGRMRELLIRLKNVGLVRVYVGIESGNIAQLKRYRRGMSLKEMLQSVQVISELGIDLDVGFIMFDPEMTIAEMRENIKFFRDNGLIHYNQWPFRPMVPNVGARCVDDLSWKGLLITRNDNFMSYDAAYVDPQVEQIANVVDQVSNNSRALFYALKMLSKKYFDPNKKDAESRLAQSIVEQNGMIYLDFMERLASERLSAQEIVLLSQMVESRIKRLAREVASFVGNGTITDERGYLTEELKKLGIPVRVHRFSSGLSQVNKSSRSIIRPSLIPQYSGNHYAAA